MITIGLLPPLTVLAFAQVELELPPALFASRHTPEFESTDFGEFALQPDRNDASSLFLGGCWKGRFHGGNFFDITLPVFNDFTDLVLFAHIGIEEVKDCWFPYYQAKFSFAEFGIAALFHAEGNDAQGLKGSRNAGNGGHGALDPNVIGAGGAASDANPTTMTGQPVIRGAASDGQVEVD